MLIAQLVELKDSAVLEAVVDVCSNPTMDSKIFFQFFSGIVDLLCLPISIFIMNMYQFLILCSVVKLYFSNS